MGKYKHLSYVTSINSRGFIINSFIEEYDQIPKTIKFKKRFKNNEFLKKLKEEFPYVMEYSSTLYENNLIENDNYAILDFKSGQVRLIVEHADRQPQTNTSPLFRKSESVKEVLQDNLTDYIVLYYIQTLDHSNENLVKRITNFILSLKEEKEKNEGLINIVIQEGNSLSLKSFKIKKPKLNLVYNYNDNFIEIHKTIIHKINKVDSNGLVLLYGPPGCGKTNYIKFLITRLKKKVIYLPPNLANEVSSPGFISFLSQHQNSVLIIEDAENILKSRRSGGNQSISNLLNISEGLLSDVLKIQVIATFNCDISEIDSALLRKGRLIAKYEFKKLTIEKSRLLSTKLKYSKEIIEPMTLAEIYNQNDIDFTEQKRKLIGFTN